MDANFNLLIMGELNVTDLMLPVGMIMVCTWLMMRLRKKKRQGPQAMSAAEQIERNRQLRGMRGDLEDLMVEIEQMAKRMSAHLDARSLQMERLIDEADARLAQLQSHNATTDSQHAGAADQLPEQSSEPTLEPTDESAPSQHVGLEELMQAAPPHAPHSPHTHQASSRADVKVETEAASGTESQAVKKSEDGRDPLVVKVHELADTGQTPEQIASALNEHAGKIELILALRSS